LQRAFILYCLQLALLFFEIDITLQLDLFLCRNVVAFSQTSFLKKRQKLTEFQTALLAAPTTEFCRPTPLLAFAARVP